MERVALQFQRGAIRSISFNNFLKFEEEPDGSAVEFMFEPRINILSGPKGEGKNSILLGIFLGCGGQISFLDGWINLQQFISYGKSEAQIQLQLHDPLLPAGKITLKRILKCDKTSGPGLFYIDGMKVNYTDYRKCLSNYHIDPENVGQFLFRRKTLNVAKLTPEKLLLETETILDPSLARMHKELISFRTRNQRKVKELEQLKKSTEEMAQKKQQMQAKITIAKRKNIDVENTLLPRVKILTEELAVLLQKRNLLKDQFEQLTATRQNLRQEIITRCSRFIKNPSEMLMNLPKNFSNSGVKNLNEKKDSVQQMEIKLDSSTELERLTAEINDLQTDISKSLSEEELEAKLYSKNADIELLVNKLLQAENSMKAEKIVLNDHQIYQSSLIQERHAIETVGDPRQNHLKALLNSKRIVPRTFAAWMYLNNNSQIFSRYVKGPLLLFVRPSDPKAGIYFESVMPKLSSNCPVLESFLVTNSDFLEQLKKMELFKGRLVTPLPENPIPEIDIRDRKILSEMGFQKVLSDLIEFTDPDVGRYFHQLVRLKTISVGQRNSGPVEADNFMRYWKANHGFQRGLYRFFTEDNQYQEMSRNPSAGIFLGLGDSTILSCEKMDFGDVRREVESKMIQNSIKTTEIISVVAAGEAQIKQCADHLKKDRSDRELLEKTLIQQKQRKAKLAEIQTRYTELLKSNINSSGKRIEDESINLQKFITTLNENMNSVSRSTDGLPQRNEFQKEVLTLHSEHWRLKRTEKTICAELNVIELDISNWQNMLKKITQDILLESGHAQEEDKLLTENMNVKQEFSSPADFYRSMETLVRGLSRFSEGSMEASWNSLNSIYVSNLKKIHSLGMAVKSFTSPVDSRMVQWQPRIVATVAWINKIYQKMFRRLGFHGEVQLKSPVDPYDFANYRLDLLVSLQDGQTPVELSRVEKSDPNRLFCLAVYLFVLQTGSSRPFRIFSELSQDLNYLAHGRLLQIFADTASANDVQCFTSSSHILPALEVKNGYLGVCTLMRTKTCVPVSDFRTDIVLEAIQRFNLPSPEPSEENESEKIADSAEDAETSDMDISD